MTLQISVYVVNSGFKVQTTPRTTKGTDISAIIGKRLKSVDSDTLGLLINQGNGSEITNQMPASRIINLSFFFFEEINNHIS